MEELKEVMVVVPSLDSIEVYSIEGTAILDKFGRVEVQEVVRVADMFRF